MDKIIDTVDIAQLQEWISHHDREKINEVFHDWHPSDIAIILKQLDDEDQVSLLKLLNNEVAAQVLLDLDEDERKDILEELTPKQIADNLIPEIDSDDAADIMNELSEEKKEQVFDSLDEGDLHTKSIVNLMKYDEDTAGGLMATELVKVQASWTVIKAVQEMRKQAADLEEVYSIYVVNETNKLLGTLSLKKLLTTSSKTTVEEVYNRKFYAVKVYQDKEEVARMFQKYDLYELPVIDELGDLLGRITVDDVLDVITEEAEKDYQLASGISQDVDVEDSSLAIFKARFPWLLIGVFGGLMGSLILQGNYTTFQAFPLLLSFVPLIAATAGNVGVQSSAIVVQGLANGSLKDSNMSNLKKEIGVSLLSGFALALIILIYNIMVNGEDVYLVPITISISIIAVIAFASLVGTIVPLILNKKGVDPAIATGPFITTSNDIFGLLIYFSIAKLILGL